MFCYFGWVTKVPDPICKRMIKFIKIEYMRGQKYVIEWEDLYKLFVCVCVLLFIAFSYSITY